MQHKSGVRKWRVWRRIRVACSWQGTVSHWRRGALDSGPDVLVVAAFSCAGERPSGPTAGVKAILRPQIIHLSVKLSVLIFCVCIKGASVII